MKRLQGLGDLEENQHQIGGCSQPVALTRDTASSARAASMGGQCAEPLAFQRELCQLPPAQESPVAFLRLPYFKKMQRRTAAKPQRPGTCGWRQSCKGRRQGLACTQIAPPTCQAVNVKATFISLKQWRLLPL